MKFRLSGNLQPPDWVLAEVETLSQLSELKILSNLCHLVCQEILQRPEASKQGSAEFGSTLRSIAQEVGWSSSDGKSAAVVLRYILTNCAKYKLSNEVAKQELGQLGLAPQQCDTILQIFREYSSNLRRKLKDVSFQHLRLDTRQSLDWRVDYVLQSSEVDHVDTSVVRLSLPLRRPGESIAAPTSPSPSRLTFDISHEKLEVLVHELRKASILMKDVAEKLN